MVLFIVGNLLSALAPDYAAMMAGRIVAALCHGAFFGIGVGRRRRAWSRPTRRPARSRSCSPASPRPTCSACRSAPSSASSFGWRSTFWAITVIGVVALDRHRRPGAEAGSRTDGCRRQPARRAARLPLRPGLALARRHGARLRRHVRRLHLHRLHAHRGQRLRRRRRCRGCSSSSASDSSSATRSAARPPTARRPHPARRARRRSPSVLVVFALTAQHPVADHRLAGADGRLRLRHRARAADARHAVRRRRPTLASGANIAAFNLGNALGAWLGGVTITAGLGYTSPIWAGAAHHPARPGRDGVRGRCCQEARRRPAGQRRRLHGGFRD